MAKSNVRLDYKELLKLKNGIALFGDPTQMDQFLNSCAKELAARLLAKVIKRTPVGQYPKGSGKTGGTLRRGWTAGQGGNATAYANSLTVILTTSCSVRFETNGGSTIEDVTAIFGEKIARPADPVREGKVFAGWYKDIHLSKEWSFDTDTVNGNMTLYAKWEDAPVETTAPETPVVEESAPGFNWLLILLAFMTLLVLLLIILIWKISRDAKKKGKYGK